MDYQDQNRPRGTGNGKPGRKRWLIAAILAVLALDYATIMRVEIFDEVKSGKSFLEAVMHGNLHLTALGILVSIVGVAWIIYLLAGHNRDRSPD